MKQFRVVNGTYISSSYFSVNTIYYIRNNVLMCESQGIIIPSNYQIDDFLAALQQGCFKEINTRIYINEYEVKNIIKNITKNTIDVGCYKGIKRETLEEILKQMNEVK